MTQTSERDVLALTVAFMIAQQRSQLEIGGVLGLSQPDVSRLLKHAKESGLIKTEIAWPSEEVRATVEARAYPRREGLINALNKLAAARKGVSIQRVDVVHALGSHQAFGRSTARSVARLFASADVAAVAWGKTISSIVDGIVNVDVQEQKNLTIIPICGEPLKHVDNGVSPSAAAKRLAAKFGGTAKSLQGVSARIPKSLSDSDAAAVRKFFRWSSDYDEIFSNGGKRVPLIEKVHMILTGVGDAMSSESDPWFRETRDAEDMKREDLEELAVGNLGGVWLAPEPTKKPDPSKVKQLKQINQRWLGIQAEHFERCANAANEQRPGVVVVALGEKKADIVLRAVGMINHLFIDRSLADAIANSLKVPEAQSATR